MKRIDVVCEFIYKIEHVQDKYYKAIESLIRIDGDFHDHFKDFTSKLINIGHAIKYQREVATRLIEQESKPQNPN